MHVEADEIVQGRIGQNDDLRVVEGGLGKQMPAALGYEQGPQPYPGVEETIDDSRRFSVEEPGLPGAALGFPRAQIGEPSQVVTGCRCVRTRHVRGHRVRSRSSS